MENEAIAILLAEPDQEIQQALLEGIDLTDLIQAATQRLQSEPQTARALLALVANDHAHAAYLLAQAYAQAGQFDSALPLIEQARAQFLADGDDVSVARTSVGQMMILGALGQHQAALELADTALQTIGERAPLVSGKLLQNQGLIHEQRGDFTAALASYAAADAIFEQGDFPTERSDILKNRGVTLLSMGAAHDALAAFEQAANLVDEATQPLRQGRTLANIGYAQQLLGNYSESLATTEAARELLERHGFSQYALAVQVDLADLFQTLNRSDDAITNYAHAHAGLTPFGMNYHIARALFGWGIAHCAAGQFEQAAEKLAAAKTAFTELDNATFVQRVTVEQASLALKEGDRAAALTLVNELLRTDLSDQTRIVALLIQFDATDDSAVRRDALANAFEIVERLPLPHLRYRLLQRQGQLAVALDDLESAETFFRAAIDIIETLRGTLQQEALRISFLHDRLTPHRELLRVLLEQERIDAAWELGEQIKARTLTEAQRHEQTDTTTEPQIATLRQELDALYNTLLDEHSVTRRTQHHATLRQRMIALERRVEQQYTALIPPQPTAAPANETANITYHLMGEELLAFVKVEKTRHVVRQLATIGDITEAVENWEVQLRWMRGGQTFLRHRKEQLTDYAIEALQELHALVFAPLEQLVKNCPELLIVPSGILHRIPFHALHDGDHYLIERMTLRCAPSVTVDQLAKRAAAPDYQHVAAIEVDDPALAYVSAEIAALIPHFTTVDQFHNATATRHAITTSTAPVLHFATHGIFRSEHPLFSGLRLHDGWLTAHDVTRLNLYNRLVVLSACESGRTQLAAGDEALGLPHAFLGAGARAVIASLWLVQDEVSAELMPNFYQQLQMTQDPAAALRNAQLAMLASRPHPYFWANFVLFGGDVR